MTMRVSACLATAGFLCAAVLGAQPARQVKDINQTAATPAIPTGRPRAAAAALCFALDDGSSGLEIWRSDGTPEGTGLLHDVAPGPYGIDTTELTELNGLVYFSALENELWVTDGTDIGTRLVKVLNPLFVSGPSGLTAFDGRVYFAARDVDHGRELWASDGTAEGTEVVQDLWPGDHGSSPYGLTVIEDSLYFFASEPDGTFGFYRLDSGSGTPRLLRSFPPVTTYFQGHVETFGPGSITAAGSTIFFVGTDSATGIELWKSDGTTAGTMLVKDVSAGAANSFPSSLTVVSGKLFFLSGSQLWMSDGTEAGTLPVAGPQPSNGALILSAFRGSLIWTIYDPNQRLTILLKTDVGGVGTTPLGRFTTLRSVGATILGDALYFSAGDVEHGVELWRTDGTAAGTRLVRDLWPGPSDSQPSGFGEFQGRLFFVASDGRANTSLWTSDGTSEGTRIVRDISLPGSDPSFFVPLGSRVFFTAVDATGSPRRLFVSDGSEPGTVELSSAAIPAFPPPKLAVWRNELYFSAADEAGAEPWKSDGTTLGTFRIADIFAGSGPSFPTGFTPLGESVLFFAQEPSTRFQLWKTDGTARGTARVTTIADFNPGQSLVGSGKHLFFSNDVFQGFGLWKTDGSAIGTIPVPANVGSVRSLTSWNGSLYFSANGGNGDELWRSDGTQSGTLLVKDIAPGFPISSPTDLTAVEGTALFFVANDGVHGRTLWKTDGTEAGTALVKPFAVVVSQLTAVGRTLFFVVNDGPHGYELWKSDGTEPGTVLVADILPGPGSSSPTALTDVGGVLVFAAADGIHGAELWRSDGTAAGTYLVQDINPGPRSSNPSGFMLAGDSIFFQADGGSSGRELWVMPVSALGGEPRRRSRSTRELPFRP